MAFIDDIMVAMETKKEHDKIVEKILKIIAENGLFIKQEKCVWKVKEVGFMEKVVIRLDKVK